MKNYSGKTYPVDSNLEIYNPSNSKKFCFKPKILETTQQNASLQRSHTFPSNFQTQYRLYGSKSAERRCFERVYENAANNVT